MQKSLALQPLTLNNVTKHDEIWSSDSDSGITVGSHSPPSKTTPDSGIGIEQLSWNLPPPPPSLLVDDAYFPAMDPRDVTAPTGRKGVLSPEEEERQRKQEYVRNTLLEYERQKKLSEEREEAIYANENRSNQQYADSVRLDSKDVDFNSNTRFGDTFRSSRDGEDKNVAAHNRRGVSPNDYAPASQMSQSAANTRDREHFSQSPDEEQTESHRLQGQDSRDVLMRDAFVPDDMFASSAGDEGYGTDSRSNTTASISSPLSSSLSSLTTDSSSSLNGSQRGVGGFNGNGSARAQPVPSSGRLVMAKRGILVKRRDLPPVERLESVTLEDRLRALTTIEEEDSGAAVTSSGPSGNSSSSVPASHPGVSAAHSGVSGSSRRPAAGRCAVYEDTSRDYESLYTVINKNRHKLGNANSALADARQRHHRNGGSHRGPDASSGRRDRDDGHSPLSPTGRQPGSGPARTDGFHRAVPVRLDADGNAYYPATMGDPRNSSGDVSKNDGTASGGIGLGGVKVNDSGEIEIDYSYYMKATPSESNDELNTYSPTHPPPELADSHSGVRFPQSDHTTQRLQGDRGDLHSPRDFSSGSGDGGGGRHTRAGTVDFQDERPGAPCDAVRPRVEDFEFSVESDQSFVRVHPRDAGLRQGGVMCSMPNLSMHGPSISRRHSAENSTYEPSRTSPYEPSRNGPYGTSRQSQESSANPVLRRNPPPGSGYAPGFRRPGQGERNSCDVGSLYRQADFNSMNVPQLAGGVAADRMSLNLGDLPRIQEQLRATSEMFLSSGPKRHQFASSSDIYRLFQGQHASGSTTGFLQGRAPPHRHSFHAFSHVALNPTQNLADVKPRLRPNTVIPPGKSDQSHTSLHPGHGPIRGNHNISVPEHMVYSAAGHNRDGDFGSAIQNAQSVLKRSSTSSLDSNSSHLREALAKGQQFVTDIVLDEEGERLSTLV